MVNKVVKPKGYSFNGAMMKGARDEARAQTWQPSKKALGKLKPKTKPGKGHKA